MKQNEMEWTGERLVTNVDGVFGVAEHLHRYAIAQQLAKGRTVLDLASGEGYGSNLISALASHVTGVDISSEAVDHANQKYASKKDNLVFKLGSASKIPLPDSSVDMVSSFETLEHTTEQEEFYSEIKRVLKPDGFMLMSTPDTVPYKTREPVNPYHVKELTTEEFIDLNKRHFSRHILFKQYCVNGSFIKPVNEEKVNFHPFSGSYDEVNSDFGSDEFYGQAFFNLALATDSDEFPDIIKCSLFNFTPQLFKEFQGSEALRHELKQAQKQVKRLEEIEQSESYKLASKLAKFASMFRRKS